jgi:hypothetical protein
MLALIDNNFQIDLSKPIDISIPLSSTDANPIAWYIEKPEIKPVKFGDWVGKVSKGSSTNFNNTDTAHTPNVSVILPKNFTALINV